MIKIGVFGAGHLGKIHIRLLKEIPDYELLGFFDPDPAVCERVTAEFGIPAYPSGDALISACDAVDIVNPTLHHFETAKAALRKSRHIFIEKPITHTIKEARALIRLATEAKVKAQVGHVERFNPAFLAVKHLELNPMFIEAHRLAQWNPRGTDVSVVLDLMIHDLDIILSIVKSEVKKVSASGVAVVSESPDIANARLEFHNGAVANLTASRISLKNMRKMRIFQRNSYLSVDFLNKRTERFQIHGSDTPPDPERLKFEFKTGNNETKFLTFETPKVEQVNSIKLELEEFAKAIQDGGPTAVSLEDATAALETAYLIIEKINKLCSV